MTYPHSRTGSSHYHLKNQDYRNGERASLKEHEETRGKI